MWKRLTKQSEILDKQIEEKLDKIYEEGFDEGYDQALKNEKDSGYKELKISKGKKMALDIFINGGQFVSETIDDIDANDFEEFIGNDIEYLRIGYMIFPIEFLKKNCTIGILDITDIKENNDDKEKKSNGKVLNFSRKR